MIQQNLPLELVYSDHNTEEMETLQQHIVEILAHQLEFGTNIQGRRRSVNDEVAERRYIEVLLNRALIEIKKYNIKNHTTLTSTIEENIDSDYTDFSRCDRCSLIDYTYAMPNHDCTPRTNFQIVCPLCTTLLCGTHVLDGHQNTRKCKELTKIHKFLLDNPSTYTPVQTKPCIVPKPAVPKPAVPKSLKLPFIIVKPANVPRIDLPCSRLFEGKLDALNSCDKGFVRHLYFLLFQQSPYKRDLVDMRKAISGFCGFTCNTVELEQKVRNNSNVWSQSLLLGKIITFSITIIIMLIFNASTVLFTIIERRLKRIYDYFDFQFP